MTGQVSTIKYKHAEPAYVETVKALGHEHGNHKLNKITITFRVPVSDYSYVQSTLFNSNPREPSKFKFLRMH